MARSADIGKFALYNFKGEPTEFYLVDEKTPPEAKPTKELGHLIMILDRSGSMYGQIEEAKAMLEKVFTLEEYHDSDLLVSLISYSGIGDVTTHFSRVPVQQIMKPGSAAVEQIRSIRATYLTCASQAIQAAIPLIKDETTCICVETDGWFNDPSPLSEQKHINALIAQLQPMKQVMVNTVAFGWADYNLMAQIANAMSGQCVKATSLKEVYNTLHDTASLLVGRTQPAIQVEAKGSDYLTAVSVRRRRINGTTSDLTIRGVTPEDNLAIYRYRKVSEPTWKKSKCDVIDHHPAIYAFARGKLAERKLNEAKYALVATKNETLLGAHAKALTAEQLTSLAIDLEEVTFALRDSTLKHPEYVISESYGLKAQGASTLELCTLLSDYRKGFTVNLDILHKTYRRRSVRKLSGRWENGSFIPAGFDAVPVDESKAVATTAFELNNQNATINMRVARPAKLVDRATGKEVKKVAGTPVRGKLSIYRNYTLIGDGNANVDVLPLNISDKKLHAALVAMGVLPDKPFDFSKRYDIRLSDMPVVAFGSTENVKLTKEDIDKLVKLRFVRSMLSAMLTEPKEAATWSEDQLADLKAHCLSAAFYFQPSTTNPYEDLEKATRTGLVDTRLSYEIGIGTKEVPYLTDIPSANEFLNRWFQVGDLKKAKLNDVFSVPRRDVQRKGGKRQPNVFDGILMPLMEKLIQAGPAAVVRYVVGDAAVAISSADSIPELLTRVENAMEDIYSKTIRPLAFYVGSSGLLPDSWNVKLLSDEELDAMDVKPKKDASCFYLEDEGLLVSVFTKGVLYSTEEGMKAASRLQEGEAD